MSTLIVAEGLNEILRNPSTNKYRNQQAILPFQKAFVYIDGQLKVEAKTDLSHWIEGFSTHYIHYQNQILMATNPAGCTVR